MQLNYILFFWPLKQTQFISGESELFFYNISNLYDDDDDEVFSIYSAKSELIYRRKKRFSSDHINHANFQKGSWRYLESYIRSPTIPPQEIITIVNSQPLEQRRSLFCLHM